MQTKYKYALVGGMAAVFAAQSIRELDKEGNIILIGDEPHPPYDRPPLSKQMLAKDDYSPDDAYSKFDDFYPKNQIELRRAVRVTAVDKQARSITTDDGNTFTYEKLLLATGARARSLDVPGASRTGVFLLRRIEDSVAIRQALQASKRVAVIGSGFLGMEVAADGLSRGLEVAIVEPKGHAWAKFASEQLGKFIQGYYESKGGCFHLNTEATAFEGEGENGAVRRVRTKSGEEIPVDAVIVAVGAELNLDLAQAAGLDVDPKDGVKVDEFLRTSDPNIWAAGDIACFQDVALGKRWHVEHHLNAKWQGQAVGKVMAGDRTPYDKVPYFFSDFLDLHMILRGDSQGGKRSVVAGDLAGGEFTELYMDDSGRLVMGVSISHEEPKLDPISDTLERLIRAKVNLSGREAEIGAAGFDINSLG
jgi:3-phenylpropionate/trans-cinnamate dioxygenase ferredoxin reductase component